MEIKSVSGKTLYVSDKQTIKEALEEAVAAHANLAYANLADANLAFSNLGGANLAHANLAHANLADANLGGANLAYANLADANLAYATLGGANLAYANLARANLAYANLAYAKELKGLILPTGEMWEKYLGEVVPALLQAGGKTMEQIVASGCWRCHSWDNCPMATAFGVHGTNECPILLRPRVEQFVQLFDAQLIPEPVLAKGS